MFSISKNPQASKAKVLAKGRSTLMAKKPSYPRKEALQPIKRKAGLTSGEDEAQGITRPGEVHKERRRTVPEETWKPQRRLGPPQPAR